MPTTATCAVSATASLKLAPALSISKPEGLTISRFIEHSLATRTDFHVCWPWPFYRNDGGYGFLQVRGKNFLAHRRSYTLFTGDDPGDLYVLHECNNPACHNPTHVFKGTQKKNMEMMVAAGRSNKGKSFPHMGDHLKKIPDEDVTLMRELHEAGMSIPDVARLFMQPYSNVYYILTRRSRKKVK